ncbi:hypothetical protein R3Q06_17530 [Rhodococcus erythropolis]|nr:hypothetical protein [Rhodococcus erythropolis]MDV6275300.1 hypothetical protein [Rhodococcus erythropolis]
MREYEIEVAGLPHTVLLTDEDAKARGLTPITKTRTVINKARTRTRNKGA